MRAKQARFDADMSKQRDRINPPKPEIPKKLLARRISPAGLIKESYGQDREQFLSSSGGLHLALGARTDFNSLL